MSEPLGIDMPEFQLAADRRAYLRKYGTLIESKNEAGKTVFTKPIAPSQLVDSDGTIIYVGQDEVVSRESGMCSIEQTPQWVLRAIMQHAKGSYANRDRAVWPETVWNVQYGIRQVFIMNKIDDDVMPLWLRKALLNFGSPMISRFLVRENPEYGETHFIGIRRRLFKESEGGDDAQMSIVDLKKGQCTYTLDDYLFPELRKITADAVTAPKGAIYGDE